MWLMLFQSGLNKAEKLSIEFDLQPVLYTNAWSIHGGGFLPLTKALWIICGLQLPLQLHVSLTHTMMCSYY
jgi:hypothetical protein